MDARYRPATEEWEAMMRVGVYLSVVFAAGAVAGGCTGTPSSPRAAEIKAQIDATTLPSGWRVDCRDDQFRAERTCFAGTFAASGVGAFQVVFVNGKGPNIMVPHDFPGRVATVRVDNGAVLPVTQAGDIVEQLKGGATAYVVHHVWPRGAERMTVDVSGFSEAYQALLGKVGI